MYSCNAFLNAITTGIRAVHVKCVEKTGPLTILSRLFLAILLLAGCYFSAAALQQTNQPPPPHECGSIDVRNDCSRLLQLEGCTVINGYLIIVLIRKANDTHEICDYEKYRFPLLREITDFLIFHDVKELTTISELFPNLTVIRGRRLFLNYALGVTQMWDLTALEFKSLVAIQRGHVFVGSSPKLCNLEKINWDRLTLSAGQNHIFPVAPETCPRKSECTGCDSGYCWSNLFCQKFENDNVVNLKQGFHHCHEECLGGCYNTTNKGCVVCKGLTDHGACVPNCPMDKYLLEHYQRCYTQDECINELHRYTYGFDCVSRCPSGFTVDEKTSNCVVCVDYDNCVEECSPPPERHAITIFNLADADQHRGCQRLNGSLVISIRNMVNENDLIGSLGSIREISGYLKIFRSPYLTSLKFLRNLRKIAGDPLESHLYAIIVYDNKNLKELWTPQQLEIDNGSMYVHRNNKLCNRFLKEFRKRVVHDKTRDSLQTSDQEVLCGPSKLLLQISQITHRSFKLTWPVEQTSDEIEIIYRVISDDDTFMEQSEFDSNVCTRVNWHRQLVFRSELTNNATHYSYVIAGLTQHTKHACLVRTFGINDKNDARSELEFVTTDIDIPTAPIVSVPEKTDNSLTIQLGTESQTAELVSHYTLQLYEFPDDINLLDRRNYCNQPALSLQDLPLEAFTTTNHNEDYDDCCARLEEAADDRRFMQNMREQFGCSLDHKEDCAVASNASQPGYVRTLTLQPNETTYTILKLERFRLYVLQVQACNGKGCSAFSMQSVRTNYSGSADKLEDLRACHEVGTKVYRIHFSEPKQPNGAIVSYVIHHRAYNPKEDSYQSHVNCVTRLQHAQSKYLYTARLNTSFNEVAVRVHSLAGDIFTHWVNVTPCSAWPATRLAGIGAHAHHAHGWNVFLVFFLIGAGGTLLWLCYKRRYWRKIPALRRYLPVQRGWSLIMRPDDSSMDDRQTLVDGFETVRFHNSPDDDQKYLE